MSDFFPFDQDALLDSANELHGWNSLVGNIAGIVQRGEQLAAQKKQLAALKEQAKIDQSRADIEMQRLNIEKKRLAAEEAERAYRRRQEEQVKQLRNLLADSVSELNLLAKDSPA